MTARRAPRHLLALGLLTAYLGLGLGLGLGATGCGGCGADERAAPDNAAPTVAIRSPASGAVLDAPGPFVLVGEASDPERGVLDGPALTWSSSRDGVLGTGAMLTARLSPGAHTLSLEAVDDAGASARASVTVTVRAAPVDNRPPVATIDAPASGHVFVEGEPIVLAGHGADPDDGELPGVALTWTASDAGVLGSGRTVTWPQPPLGTHRIVLVAIDRAGAVGRAAIDVEVVGAGTNRRPVVTLTVPVDGAALTAGQPVQLAGAATDPEDGALTGLALVWTSSRDGELGRGASVTRADLSVGVHRLTLTATDRLGLTASAEVTVAVNPAGNRPPAAAIARPSPDAVVLVGDAVPFEGSAVDPEDGALAGDALTWSSDRDGALGHGASFTHTLSEGQHRITLQAADRQGNLGVATVRVRVLAANRPPTVTIRAPGDGASFDAGTPIAFRGEASDAEDGRLSGAALTWRSSRDGVLGTGEAITFASLGAGAHDVTLSAIDSQGEVGSTHIRITIDATVPRLPPVARLSGPLQTVTGAAVTYDGSASTAPSGRITDYRFDPGDGTPAVSGASAAFDHTFAAAGTFVVTLTVTDDAGAHGDARLTVTVVKAARVPALVVDSDDELGVACDLAAGTGDALHVVFHDRTHPSIWYAAWNGTAWQVELIDGAGFEVGGYVKGPLALAVDASNRPHVAYSIGDRISYATRAASGTWTVERVDTSIPGYGYHQVAIALDSAHGDRPTVVYASTSYKTVVAYRNALQTWTAAEAASSSQYFTFTGGLAFWNGVAYLTTGYAFGGGAELATWSSLNGFQAPQPIPDAGSGIARLVLDEAHQPVILNAAGIYHRSSGNAWTHSEVETSALDHVAITRDAAGTPIVAWSHGGQLEIARPGLGRYWDRSYQGPMDSTDFHLAVDHRGDVRACLFRSGQLMVY